MLAGAVEKVETYLNWVVQTSISEMSTIPVKKIETYLNLVEQTSI